MRGMSAADTLPIVVNACLKDKFALLLANKVMNLLRMELRYINLRFFTAIVRTPHLVAVANILFEEGMAYFTNFRGIFGKKKKKIVHCCQNLPFAASNFFDYYRKFNTHFLENELVDVCDLTASFIIVLLFVAAFREVRTCYFRYQQVRQHF